MKKEIINWLIEDNNLSIKYRTLTELLDESLKNNKIIELKKNISESKQVKFILEKMEPEGYWLQTNPRTKITVGDDVEYGSFATTHFCLSYLSELGLDKSHPLIAKASERYLDLIKPDGDFWNHFSCLYSYNIRTFIKLGYRKDKRLNKTINLLLTTERLDGGYLCEMHEKRRKNAKSCIRGAVKALLAFSEMPEYWSHKRCNDLIDYFLNRNCIFQMNNKKQPICKDVITTTYPITWKASITEILYALSKMGYGKNKALKKAWEVLKTKVNKKGQYILDWSPTQSLLKSGTRGEPNKWITLYALLAKKYAEEKWHQNN
jgi:hypothetical protein